VTTDALGAANDRAPHVGEDAGPLIGFNSVGQIVGSLVSGLIFPAISAQVGGECPPSDVAMYRTRGRYATITAARAQLGKNRAQGRGWMFLACRPDSTSV
jgi:hypothetical protein